MSNKLEQILSDSSFILWLKNKCSREEERKWEEWLREAPEHQVLVREAKEIVNAVDSEYDIPNPQKELGILNKKIDQYECHQKLKRVTLLFSAENKSYQRMARLATAAVILITAIFGGIVGYNYTTQQEAVEEIVEKPEFEEYRTDYGEKITFRLSDGSLITLNGNSKLTFSSTIKEGLNSEVWLEGEAYFNIAHLTEEEKRSFTVHTDEGAIQVLGTRFGVNTYQQETKTVLEEGKISILTDASDTGYELTPGKMARFKANDNKITVKDVNPQVYTSWKEDKMIFIETPMEEVATRIENTFGIEVVLADKVANELLSGSIKSTDLDVIEEALGEILKTNVVQKDKQMLVGIE